MKKCFKCNLDKTLDAFSKHKGMSDGHLGKCKECAVAYSKTHRLENPELYKAFEQERRKGVERKAQSAAYLKAYRAKHPTRVSCNQKLARAVKKGIIKPDVCFVCGDSDSVGHHPDYDQPLSVVWLCRPHHREVHATLI